VTHYGVTSITCAAYVAGALAVGVAAWVGVHAVNGSNILSPGPLLTILPAWIIGENLFGSIDAGPKVIPILGALLFLVVGIPLFTTRSRAVWPANVFTALLVAASIAFFIVSWSYGARYQGTTFTAILMAINLAFAAASAFLGLRASRLRTYRSRYIATLVPCVWSVWYAFPWLGEMP